MLHKYLYPSFISIVSLFISTSSFADRVTGDISQSTTWTASGNPWVITAPSPSQPIREIRVTSNATLTIEPGVIIQIDGALAINIEGSLIARGTEQNPITIRPQQADGQWHTFVFQSSSAPAIFSNGVYQSGSILEYVNLESGGGPSIFLSASFPSTPAQGVVYLNGGKPYINQVSITDGEASGIYISDVGGYVKVENTTITNNHDTSGENAGGITIQDSLATIGSDIEVRNCTIVGNSTNDVDSGGGVYAEKITALRLVGNVISDNVSDGAGGGVYLFDLSNPQSNYVVQNNTISNNIAALSGGGISIETANVTFLDNQVIDNVSTLDFGGGLYIYGNSTVQVDGNVFKYNDAGSNGGGISVARKGSEPNPSVVITKNAIIDNNTGDTGGGVHIDNDAITITYNFIADNQVDGDLAAMDINSGGTVEQNTIVRNQANSIVAIQNDTTASQVLSFINNNVSQNSSTVYAINNTASTLPSISGNNIINNGAGFYLSNNAIGAGILSANNNWFGTTDQTVLQNNIDVDIDYSAPATTIFTNSVPISPPGNFNIVQNGDAVTMTWGAPVEPDLAGYRVYWGTNSAPTYENSIDVGLNQSHTVSGIGSTQNYYFAVTAYDSDYATITDDPATLINEKQTSGNESWFSEEAVVLGVVNTGGGGGGGGSTAWWSLFMLIGLIVFRRSSLSRTLF